MGGKGRRRREKNYMAAHGGGNTRLPPPPDPSSVDAVPSKLRKIFSLAGAARKPSNSNNLRNTGNAVEKGVSAGGGNSISTGSKRKRNDEKHIEHDKKKKKRKKKKADDLRFVAADESGSGGSQRKARRKQRSGARKKKHKSGSEECLDFPGREQVKFGDVVEAPPKLTSVPKGLKTTQDASQERLRLQAVDAYRKRKAWVSRPGVQLPPPVTSSLF